MFTLRGITEKELKRRIKKQRRCISLQEQHENFYTGGEKFKMRNASDQLGENNRQ